MAWKNFAYAVVFSLIFSIPLLRGAVFGQEPRPQDDIATEYVGGVTPGDVAAGTADAAPAEAIEGSGWEGNKFEERRHKQLKYDEYGQVDASPEVRAMEVLPRDAAGFVDWAAALSSGMIAPRDVLNSTEKEEQTVLFNGDVTIKAKLEFMVDAVFPHRPHNNWLSCGVCHPKIFAMKAGGTNFTMQEIWQGGYCGRCHDKVAFPTRHCYRCHTGPKKWETAPVAAEGPAPAPSPPPASRPDNRRPVFAPR